MSHPFDDEFNALNDDDDAWWFRLSGPSAERMRLRELLAAHPEYDCWAIGPLNDTQVRTHLAELRRIDRRAQSAPESARPNVQSAPEPPQPVPLPAKIVKPAEEEQKFKLAELVEVVQRAKFGSVVGAAAASKAADCPKVADRSEKDSDAFKQFVNLDKDIDGAPDRHPEHGRYVELRARIEWTSGDKSKSLAGKKVHWAYTLVPQSGAKRPAALDGEQNAGFGRANGSKTEISTTDKAGWTPVMKFYVSQYAGDRFSISAQADEQESGKASGDTLSAGPYVAWRKFWYQMTHAQGKVITAPADSVSAYARVAADLLAADAVVYKKGDVADAKRTLYPQWMVSQLV